MDFFFIWLCVHGQRRIGENPQINVFNKSQLLLKTVGWDFKETVQQVISPSFNLINQPLFE